MIGSEKSYRERINEADTSITCMSFFHPSRRAYNSGTVGIPAEGTAQQEALKLIAGYAWDQHDFFHPDESMAMC